MSASEQAEKEYFICDSLSDTEKAAKNFSRFATRGRCFALYGDLGFGKTTFTQYLIKFLNPKIESINSPTFNIIQTYPSDACEIWHVDCYRLKSPEEFFELGLDEQFPHCISIIEWPEIIEQFLPNDTIRLKFEKTDDRRIIYKLS